MALITTPQNPEYDAGFESTFGRKCFYCKKPIDRESAAEWDAQAHELCEAAATAFRDANTQVITTSQSVEPVSTSGVKVTLVPPNDVVVHDSE